MLAITLADLRFRLRQFLIAVAGAGVVFAMALLLTGMVKGFYNEVTRTVESANADVWVLPEGTSGPFTSVRSFPESTVARLAKVPAIRLYRELTGGAEEPLEVLGPERYFGELAPLLRLPRSASAAAFGATTVTSYTLRRFRRSHPTLTPEAPEVAKR